MEQTAKKPVYKKWWFWVIIAVAAVIIIGAAASGNTDDNDNGGGNNGGGNTVTNSYIGDTVTSGSAEFTVLSVDNLTRLGGEFLGEDTDNNFIVVELKIKNTGNSELTLYSTNFEVKKGTSTYNTHSGGIYLDNGFYVIETLGSGLSKTIFVVFETPTESTEEDYTLNVRGSTFSTKKSIILTIG